MQTPETEKWGALYSDLPTKRATALNAHQNRGAERRGKGS